MEATEQKETTDGGRNVRCNDMLCAACKERGQTWTGDSPRCGFSAGEFGENWNCATVNMIRDICYEGQELPGYVDYQYCDDQKYATICVDAVKGIEDCPLALWVSWYKNRGGTDAMWLLFEKKPPRRPTAAECLLIVDWHKAHNYVRTGAKASGC
jgi:hypothetical protein